MNPALGSLRPEDLEFNASLSCIVRPYEREGQIKEEKAEKERGGGEQEEKGRQGRRREGRLHILQTRAAMPQIE